MITDAILPAAFASTEATYPAKTQIRALSTDYAMALGLGRRQRYRRLDMAKRYRHASSLHAAIR
jgi:hypothetical protein